MHPPAGIPMDRKLHYLELFAKEVMPKLRHA